MVSGGRKAHYQLDVRWYPAVPSLVGPGAEASPHRWLSTMLFATALAVSGKPSPRGRGQGRERLGPCSMTFRVISFPRFFHGGAISGRPAVANSLAFSL